MRTLPPLDATPDPRAGAGSLRQDRPNGSDAGFACVLSSVGGEQASAAGEAASSPAETASARQTAPFAFGLPDAARESAADASGAGLAALVGATPLRPGGSPTQAAGLTASAGSSAPTLRDLVEGLGAGAGAVAAEMDSKAAGAASPSTRLRREAAAGTSAEAAGTVPAPAPPAIGPAAAAAHGGTACAPLAGLAGSPAVAGQSTGRPVASMPPSLIVSAGTDVRSAPAAVLADIVVTTAIAPAVGGDFARRLVSREAAASASACGIGSGDGTGDAGRTAETDSGAEAIEPCRAAPVLTTAQVTFDSRDERLGQAPAMPTVETTAAGGASLQPLAGATAAPIAAIVESAAMLASSPAPAVEAGGAPILASARTMTVQLSYGDLGTIAVRLHLVGRSLDIRLSATDARTASLIDHDRGVLSEALRDQHFDLRSLVIQGGDHQPSGDIHAPANESAGDGSRPGSGGGAPTFAGGGSSSGHRGSVRGGAPPPARRTAVAADPAADAGAGARPRALYV